MVTFYPVLGWFWCNWLLSIQSNFALVAFSMCWPCLWLALLSLPGGPGIVTGIALEVVSLGELRLFVTSVLFGYLPVYATLRRTWSYLSIYIRAGLFPLQRLIVRYNLDMRP